VSLLHYSGKAESPLSQVCLQSSIFLGRVRGVRSHILSYLPDSVAHASPLFAGLGSLVSNSFGYIFRVYVSFFVLFPRDPKDGPRGICHHAHRDQMVWPC